MTQSLRICVYAASSNQVASDFHDAAFQLGETLAKAGHSIVYGGGSQGLMGALADGALKHQGQVIGILPKLKRLRLNDSAYISIQLFWSIPIIFMRACKPSCSR